LIIENIFISWELPRFLERNDKRSLLLRYYILFFKPTSKRLYYYEKVLKPFA